MTELTAERGYENVAIRDLTGVAKVSSRTFYTHFSGKQACFESVHESASRQLTLQLLAAQANEVDLARGPRRIIGLFLEELARDPRLARLFLIESQAVGAESQDRTRGTMRVLEEGIARSFDLPSSKFMPSTLVVEGVTLGIERMARSRLIAGRDYELLEIVEPLSDWAFSQCNDATVAFADSGWPVVVEGARSRLPIAQSSSTWRGEEDKPSRVEDRALLLAAVAKLAAVQDYRNLNISLVCDAAGVSRRRFRAQFEGLEDCLLSALEARACAMLIRAEGAIALGRSWAGGVYRAILGICHEVATDSTLAGLLFGKAGAAVDWGLWGAERRERLLASLSDRLRDCTQTPRCQKLQAEASVEAAMGMFRARVAGKWVESWPHLAVVMAVFITSPVVGAESALTAIRAEAEALLPPDFGQPLARVA
jgi:AcrR family transcriptional regulator